MPNLESINFSCYKLNTKFTTFNIVNEIQQLTKDF